MIDVLQLARKAAEGRHAVSEGDAHSLRFDELERFAALVLEEAASQVYDKGLFSKCASSGNLLFDTASEIRSLKPKGGA